MYKFEEVQLWQGYWSQFKLQIIAWAPKFTISVIILLAFLLIAYITNRFFKKNINKWEQRKPLIQLLANLISTAIVIVGVITFLATIGVNIAALLASLGLLGFSLGLAFKDFLSNSIAGFMLLIYQPFKLYDCINVTNFTGHVIDINLRYTTLEAEDQKIILIPNQNLLSMIISIKREE